MTTAPFLQPPHSPTSCGLPQPKSRRRAGPRDLRGLHCVQDARFKLTSSFGIVAKKGLPYFGALSTGSD